MYRIARARLRALLLVLAVSIGGCGADAIPMRPLAGSDTVLAFGDSLTFGTGARASTSYPAQLASLIGRSVVSSGVPGEVSNDGLVRLPAVLEEHGPRLVILCHGGNDLLRKMDLAQTERNLRHMVAVIRATGAQVLMLGVPKPSLLLTTAAHYDRIAEQLQVPYIRDAFSDILGERALKADSVHPNAAGYRRLAEIIAAYLHQAGAVS
jgi:acyl-CoA thioesterase I